MQNSSTEVTTHGSQSNHTRSDLHAEVFHEIPSVHRPIRGLRDVSEPTQLFNFESREHLLLSTGLAPSQVQNAIEQVETFVSEQHGLGSPRLDLLLSLVQFNVFRALASNTFALGFTFDWLTCDAISISAKKPNFLKIQIVP